MTSLIAPGTPADRAEVCPDLRRRSAARWVLAARVLVVAGLVLALTGTGTCHPRSVPGPSAAQVAAGERALWQAMAIESRARQVRRLRDSTSQVAQAALDRAQQARAAAVGAGVPADRLAALDAAAAAVTARLAQLQAAPVAVATRTGATPTAGPGATVAPTPAAPTPAVQPSTAPRAPAPSPVAADPGGVQPASLPVVTTPQTLPDAVADTAGILDVARTEVDQVQAALPDVSGDVPAQSLVDAVDALAVSVADVDASTTAATVAAAARAAAAQAAALVATQQVEAARAAAAAAQASRLAADAHSLDAYSNGQIPLDALCSPAFAPTAHLRCDAAQLLDGLDQAYRARFGTDLPITDSYRSLDRQLDCATTRGSLCAEPGTSKHGLGLAVDVGGPGARSGTVEHQWLLDTVAQYGWSKPAWSLDTGSKPEAWHFEFTGVPAS